MYSIINEIDFLEKRYSVILGDKSFVKLHSYIIGFLSAVSKYKIGDNSFSYNEFSLWVCDYMKVSRENSMNSWDNIILTHCNNDDKKAFDFFFILFNEYKKTR